MTPTNRLTIARMISAVTANFGTAERGRSIRLEIPNRDELRSGLEILDLVPQRAILALVGRPDLLLRHFAELVDFGFHHRHADGFEQGLGLREMIDRLGLLAGLF